jgi:small subunit ribosomal protein S9
MTDETKFIWGTGRRKTSVARARIRKGTGKFIVNRRELSDYFGRDRDKNEAQLPLKTTNTEGQYDVYINVRGGGSTGQAGAISLGISKALLKADELLTESLRGASLLTRDSRMKERKKYGRKGARAGFQWTKR